MAVVVAVETGTRGGGNTRQFWSLTNSARHALSLWCFLLFAMLPSAAVTAAQQIR